MTASSVPPSTLVSLSFPQSTITEENTIYIPYRQAGQLFLVEGTIDTITGWFIFDTGSERLVLNENYFPPDPEARSVTSAGNTGLIRAASEKQVDSMKVEVLVLRNLTSHIINLSHIELKKNERIIGILGYDAFRSYSVFVDTQNKLIALTPENTGPVIHIPTHWGRPYDSTSFDLHDHLIILKTEVNGVRLKMTLDSGAELNLLDRRVPRKVVDNFTILKRVNMIGVGNREVEVLAGKLKDVRCGNQSTAEMNTLLTSLDEINRAFQSNTQGVLGFEFFKNRRTLIDYKRKKLYFFQPERS